MNEQAGKTESVEDILLRKMGAFREELRKIERRFEAVEKRLQRLEKRVTRGAFDVKEFMEVGEDREKALRGG